MKVNELAKALNTSADTVRYYTRQGLLSPIKSTNGYKDYSEKDLSRLQFILSARHLGFSVNDIKAILIEADQGKSACPMVKTLFQQRLAETEAQFQHMLALRIRMQTALAQWELMDEKLPNGEMICHLIGQFTDNTAKGCCNDNQ